MLKFWLAEDGKHVMFQCSHAYGPSMLPVDADKGWIVASTDPLTVTPSILVEPCGCHGWITDGQWVSA